MVGAEGVDVLSCKSTCVARVRLTVCLPVSLSECRTWSRVCVRLWVSSCLAASLVVMIAVAVLVYVRRPTNPFGNYSSVAAAVLLALVGLAALLLEFQTPGVLLDWLSEVIGYPLMVYRLLFDFGGFLALAVAVVGLLFALDILPKPSLLARRSASSVTPFRTTRY